jgi:16S rRNA (guanine(966)-N(2))-methyltransferase RsmD
MIITGGEARGRRIASPEGMAVRPTSSKMRQAFFNIVGQRVAESNFLDIFAGSGLMGLEALSRGARLLVSIEEVRKLARALEATLKTFDYDGQVICADFRQAIPQLERSYFDIIYADPPYKSPFATSVLQTLDRHCLVKPDGVVAVEHAKGYKLPTDLMMLTLVDTRVYGQSAISFFVRTLES